MLPANELRIRPGIELANLTDPGCERLNNEDYYCYAEPEADDEFLRRGRLAVVADGMGGHSGGEVASGIAVDTIRHAFLHSDAENTRELLIDAFRNANAAIERAAQANPDLRGMGTTCTALVLKDGSAYFAHVGDSRLYLLRDSRMQQLTADHSVVGQLVAAGALAAEDAASHPRRHVLTSALGSDGSGSLDVSDEPMPVFEDDVFLLCTDGLHSILNDDVLLEILSAHGTREACRRLIDLAKERGAPDNVTVQVIKITESGSAAGA